MGKISIWEPRWRDRTVLIAKRKVQEDNTIVFTKTKLYPGEHKIKGSIIRQCPLGDNTKIPCYIVPLSLVVG